MKISSLLFGCLLTLGLVGTAVAATPVVNPTDIGTAYNIFVTGYSASGNTQTASIQLEKNGQKYYCQGEFNVGIGDSIQKASDSVPYGAYTWYASDSALATPGGLLENLAHRPAGSIQMIVTRGANNAGRLDIVDSNSGKQLLMTNFMFSDDAQELNDKFSVATSPISTKCSSVSTLSTNAVQR